MQNKTAPTTSFEDWLSGLNLEDSFDDVHSLYRAVSERDSYGPFSCSTKGDMTFVTCEAETDQTLVLASEKARNGFIVLLEKLYGGDLTIEGQYYYNKQMEKMD